MTSAAVVLAALNPLGSANQARVGTALQRSLLVIACPMLQAASLMTTGWTRTFETTWASCTAATSATASLLSWSWCPPASCTPGRWGSSHAQRMHRGVVACRTAVCTCTGGGRACMSRVSGSVVSCRGGGVVEVRQRRLPLHCCPLCMATTSTLPPAELRPAALLVRSAHSPQAGCTLAAQPAQRTVQGVRDSNI